MNYPKDFINRVICENNLEAMKEIPDESIDLILTDAPYTPNKNKNFNSNFEIKTDDEYKKWLSIRIKEMYRILKKDSFLLSDFFRPKLPLYIEVFSEYFNYYDELTAYVINSMANCAFGLDLFTPSLVFRKGNAKVKSRYMNVIKVVRMGNEPKYRHPTQKYLYVYKSYIRMLSNENDIVLDPFLGSGTTAVACKELGRKFIGIEISPDYCKVAEERLKLTKRDSKQLIIR